MPILSAAIAEQMPAFEQVKDAVFRVTVDDTLPDDRVARRSPDPEPWIVRRVTVEYWRDDLHTLRGRIEIEGPGANDGGALMTQAARMVWIDIAVQAEQTAPVSDEGWRDET